MNAATILLAALLSTPGNLTVKYAADMDGDGVTETPVCNGVHNILKPRDRGLHLLVPSGQTPCSDVQPGTRWSVRADGYVRFDGPVPGQSVMADIVADVNDGLTLTLMDGGIVVCEINFWGDVPDGDNYHSTDANGITDVCTEELVEGKTYELALDFYHQSDAESRGTHARAYLELWFTAVYQYGWVAHYNPTPLPGTYEIERVRVKVKARQDSRVIDVKLRMRTDEDLTVDDVVDDVYSCFE